MTIQMEAKQSDSQQYLSLREAAQLYGYTRDHLGLMIRRGKLEGVRLGNYYATTISWMDEYIKNYSDSNNSKLKTKFSNKFRSSILDKKQFSDIPSTAVKRDVRNPKFIVKQESTPPNFGELQKYIDRVLDRIVPQAVSAPAQKLSTSPIVSMPSAADLTRMSGDHEIIILPVRKMHDFERQIIISQVRQQKKQ